MLLLALLAGVSYLKVKRDQSGSADAFEKGKQSSESENLASKAAADSLADLLKQTQLAWSDSVETQSKRSQGIRDSLLAEIAGRDSTLAAIAGENETLAAKPEPGASATAESSSPKRQHEILAHYKQMVKQLPSDLSNYERRVALKEIRHETARKFSISTSQLDSLRKDNNLNF